MYSTIFVLVLLSGLALAFLGVGEWVIGGWVFGVWFTAFIGTMNISWELLKYRNRNRDPSSSTREEQNTPQGLAPSVQLAEDTKIGFIVTILGLIALILSFYLALTLRSFF